jgi:DNA-binding MarR family transcriptional regulator
MEMEPDMTTPPAAFAQFGYTLAFAERTLTATLRRHLSERGVEPETWYALRLIAAGGPGLARQTLSRELEGSRTMTADSTRRLLARLAAQGLIRGDAEVELTPEGETLHRSLGEYIAGPTAQLLAQFEANDVQTTIRTLQAIAERAAEELAVAN